MGAFSALINSEKAVAGGVLVVCATVLVALGYLPATEWVTYTQWIFGIYVAGKTATSSVALIADAKTGIATSPIEVNAPAKEN